MFLAKAELAKVRSRTDCITGRSARQSRAVTRWIVARMSDVRTA